MRFISEHSRTMEILREWAGKDVIVAKFFFWNAGNAGTTMEKSQRGLLQSLLFQVMDGHREIISHVVPDRWNGSKSRVTSPPPWTLNELSKALEAIIHSSMIKSRLCFFIDGLDEFEGDHYDFVKYLAHLSGSHAIKLCVSSRPWKVFLDAYGPFTERNFALQELTATDMDKYIQQNLEHDDRFKRLAQQDPAASNLIWLIRFRAEGVFLWVKLVVKELRRGLGESDTVNELQKRLNRLPTELNALFQHILDNIDPIYQKYAVRCLVLQSLRCGMTAITYSFVESDADNANAVFEAPIHALTQDGVAARADQGRNLVNKWCKDLLEVKARSFHRTEYPRLIEDTPEERRSLTRSGREEVKIPVPFNEVRKEFWEESHPTLGRYSVDFPHRTIQDFIEATARDGTLQKLAGPDFEPRETSSRLFLLLAKCAPDSRSINDIVEKVLWPIGDLGPNNHTSSRLIKELDHIGQSLRRSGDSNHWSVDFLERYDRLYGDIEGYQFAPMPEDIKHSGILSLALRFGLNDFFLGNFDIACEHTTSLIQYLLECALTPFSPFHPPEKDVVLELIKRHGDVNEIRSGGESNSDYSIWQRFLFGMLDVEDFEYVTDADWEGMIDIVNFLLQHGADPNVKIRFDDYYKEGVEDSEVMGVFVAPRAFECSAEYHYGTEKPRDPETSLYFVRVQKILEKALEAQNLSYET